VTDVDFLILANHAEVQNGLLYLAGGGWSEHHRGVPPQGQPPPSSIGIAVGVRVPWTDTNTPLQLMLAVEDADGMASLVSVAAGVTTGRAPNLPPGSDQIVVMAFNVHIQFPHAGEYRVIARLGEQARTVAFRVHDLPMAQMPNIPAA
jgi:hypothetical protein